MGSSRLVGAALILIVVWIVVYWFTPSPGQDAPLRVSRGEAPAPITQPQTPAPQEAETVPPAPEQSTTTEDDTGRPSDGLEDVSPDELAEFEEERGTGESEFPVIPPTTRTYVSQQGDTFESIARKFFGSRNYWGVVANANPNVDPNRLGPGTTLSIPVDPRNVQGIPADGQEEPPLPEPDMTKYIVARGDTLSEISKALYGRASLWRRIVDANPGLDPERLRPGMVLKIPPPPAAEDD
ncbi:MAG: LysM peptidoglycan-binding domain-containing protein [Planctomycetota bacterium]